MIKKSWPIAASSLLLLLGIAGPAAAASDSPITPPGESAIEEYAKSVGVDFLDNQKKLSEFKYWITQLPGIYDAGYVEQVNNAKMLSVKALWKGASPLRETVATEGRVRGITVTFSERPYSMLEINSATEALMRNDKAFEPLGFRIASIGGIGDDAGQIAIRGYALKSEDNLLTSSERTAVEKAAREITKLPIEVIDGVQSRPATRMNDYSPFNSGAYLINANGMACSTGFALKGTTGPGNWTSTARHCDGTSWWYARDNSGSSAGMQWRDSPDGQAALLSADGSMQMFDGAWNNTAGYSKPVAGFHDLSLGDYVCTSGGNSGVHCNIGITYLNFSWNDGYGYASQMEGYQATDGQWAAIQGDSVGPVLVPYGNGSVGAAGMIQAVAGTLFNNGKCGSVRDGGANLCSRYVWFTSTRTIANSLGMNLVTW
ncbi:S1 family peptidase [Arthrobacter sp. StoSoilA2]|uniref:S1 family peptidase n=1 Tax=Arthrobacter sp. StoSoilA2 TaxID=2830990 RepID=UPI001CC4B931|nr:S1 family peptidase [Arthrobacter sp. StoSoilA2]